MATEQVGVQFRNVCTPRAVFLRSLRPGTCTVGGHSVRRNGRPWARTCCGGFEYLSLALPAASRSRRRQSRSARVCSCLPWFDKNWKTSAVSTTDRWLKLNFASCVISKTRSLGVLVLCSICNMVFVNYIYDMVVDTQFHKFYGRLFARVLYLFIMKYIGRGLPWVLQGSIGRCCP